MRQGGDVGKGGMWARECKWGCAGGMKAGGMLEDEFWKEEIWKEGMQSCAGMGDVGGGYGRIWAWGGGCVHMYICICCQKSEVCNILHTVSSCGVCQKAFMITTEVAR
jgi:hypothetical protein